MIAGDSGGCKSPAEPDTSMHARPRLRHNGRHAATRDGRRATPWLWPAALCALLHLGACGAADEPEGPWPDPALSPRAVVELQLEALRAAGDEVDAFDVALRFASPSNRDAIGNEDGFRALFDGDGYAPLVGHRRALAHGESRRDGHAFVPVEITGADGARSGFLYALSLQADGRWRGCWMIDGVVPVDLERIRRNPELTI